MKSLVRPTNEGTLAPISRSGLDRWDPWGEFKRLRSDMDRLFGGIAGDLGIDDRRSFRPEVDLYETEDHLVLTAALPGMNREDVDVKIQGDAIQISGERRSHLPADEKAEVHWSQSSYGRFDLRYTLPVEVKSEEAKATYRDGLLEVRIPKSETAKPRSVQVTVE